MSWAYMLQLLPTIQFLDDWRKYPAHIHHNTKNASAIHISMVLKQLGVKNHSFMLATHDPMLLNIDPFDYSKMTPEIAERIWIETRRNHWYYFREICRIPTTGGAAVPFGFHRGNIALIWLYYNDIDVGLVQPRQTGKTMGTQGIMGHQIYFQGYKFDIGMYTKDQNLLQDNVTRLKDIRDEFPKYLLQKDGGGGKDKDAKEGISYTVLKNYYKTYVNSNNERDAYKLGRKLLLCGLLG